MRNLFKFVCVLALFAFGSSAFGQEKYVIDFSRKISQEQKGDKETKLEIFTASEFSEQYDGTLKLVYYIDREASMPLKILSVTVSTNNERMAASLGLAANTDCPEGYTKCAKKCTDKPTTVGVILCTGYCIIQCD